MRSRPWGGTWVSFLPKIYDAYLFSQRVFPRAGNPSKCKFMKGNTATHHDELAGDVLDAVETVVVLAVTESVRVDVGGEVAHG